MLWKLMGRKSWSSAGINNEAKLLIELFPDTADDVKTLAAF